MTQAVPPSPTQRLTQSEVLPFRSKKISLLHSRATLPLSLTVMAFFFFTLMPFNTRADIDRFIDALGCFMALIIFIEIYYYAAVPKSIWAYVPAALFVVLQLVIFAEPWFLIFHQLLGGEPNLITPATSPIEVIRIYFVGPGCMEETIKACPALIGLWLARRAAKHPERPVGRLKRAMTITGPMDGLMTGVAAAIGFLLVETLGQYVPDSISRQMSEGVPLGTASLIGLDTLITRIINVVMGHGAWAGITGYFIGLAVRHREAQFRLIFGSLLLAAVLHAGWDSSIKLDAIIPLLVFGILSPLLFLSCLVKARQIQLSQQPAIPDRSMLIQHGAPPWAAPPAVAPAPAAAAPSGAAEPEHASRLARLVTAVEHAFNVHGKGHPPPIVPQAPPPAKVAAPPTPAMPSPPAPVVQKAPAPPVDLPRPTAATRTPPEPTPVIASMPTSENGAAPARGPIRLVFMVDRSGSMAGERMAAVAYAVRSLLPMLSQAAEDHPAAALSIDVLGFGDDAAWVTDRAVPLRDYTWSDIPAGGASNLGAALALVTQRLGQSSDEVTPVLVLLSDGLPTDDPAAAFAMLLSTPAGARAVRVGVAVGEEADGDFLRAFGGRLDQKPLTPETLGELPSRMPWPASTANQARPLATAAAPAGAVW